MDQNLSYKDEADRAFGAAGMTVAIVVCNAEDILGSIDIDAPDSADILTMADDYYFAGQHAKSVSAAWQQTLSAFRATLVMASGNILSRYLVGYRRPVGAAARRALREAVETDGTDTCQLEHDEIDALFDNTFDYLTRIFSHNGVAQLTSSFADTILSHRHLSRNEILHYLAPLSRL